LLGENLWILRVGIALGRSSVVEVTSYYGSYAP
jgi:hypothetical protein